MMKHVHHRRQVNELQPPWRIFLVLAERPDVQAQLRGDSNDVRASLGEDVRRPGQAPVTRSCHRETLRVYGPAVFTVRR